MPNKPWTPDQDAIERRLLKDAEAAVAASTEDVAMPPQLLFPGARVDVLGGRDPVSGAEICNLSILAGNGSIQVVLPLPRLARIALARGLLQGTEYRVINAEPVNGDGVIEEGEDTAS